MDLNKANSDIEINSSKDHMQFLLHGVSAIALMATVTTIVASPIITGLAIAGAGIIHFGASKIKKNKHESSLPDPEKTTIEGDFKKEYISDRSQEIDDKIQYTLSKLEEYSEKLGLKETPSLHLLDDEAYGLNRTYLGDRPEHKPRSKTLLSEAFNYTCNAMAFENKKKRIIFTEPAAKTLSKEELNAVSTHELGHIAAGHVKRRGLVDLITKPAMFTSGLFAASTFLFNLKNFAVFASSLAITFIATAAYLKTNKLKPNHKPEDKVKVQNFAEKTYLLNVSGLGLIFAPEVTAVIALSFATANASKLINNSYSRRGEFQADRLSVEINKDPKSMVDSLSKIAKNNQEFAGIDQKSKLKPKGYVSNAFKKIKELNSTHPSFTKRHANIKKVARASGL